MADCHSQLPIRAVTFNRPQPSSCHFKFSLISFANSAGSEAKYQPPGDEYCQTFAKNVYLIFPFNYSLFIVKRLSGKSENVVTPVIPDSNA